MSKNLWDAAAAGDIERVRELLCQGADPDLPREGQTALLFAAANGQTEVAKLLLANGADIEYRDTMRMTALHWSVRNTELAVSELLLENGADPYAGSLLFGETPVDIARQRGDLAMLRLVVYNYAKKTPVNTVQQPAEPEREEEEEKAETPQEHGLQKTIQEEAYQQEEDTPPSDTDHKETPQSGVVPAPPVPVAKRVPPPPEQSGHRAPSPPRHL